MKKQLQFFSLEMKFFIAEINTEIIQNAFLFHVAYFAFERYGPFGVTVVLRLIRLIKIHPKNRHFAF